MTFLPLLDRTGERDRATALAVLFYTLHVIGAGWIFTAQFFLGLALIAAAVALRRGSLTLPEPEMFYPPLVLFIAGSVLSSLFSPDVPRSLRHTGEWFPFLALPLAITLFRQTANAAAAARKALIAFGGLLSIYGVTEYFVLGRQALENRIDGPTGHVMTYSGLLLQISLWFVVLSFDRRTRSVAGSIVAVVTSFVLVLTLTRSAWIGWVAGFASLLAARSPRRVVWLATAAVTALLVMPMPFFARMVSTFDLEQSSNLDRIRMWQAGAAIIRDHPLVGIGLEQIEQVYPLYRSADAPRANVQHLHNNVMQLWAERGVVVVFAYLAFVTTALSALIRRGRDVTQRPLSDAAFAAVVGVTVAGLFEFNFGDTEVLLLTLALLAQGVSGAPSERQSEAVGDPARNPAD